jgi:multidrug transporter EmrE-like cation transporter
MKKYFLLIILAAASVEVVADILFKKWSINGKNIFILIGIALYIVGTVIWAFSLKFEMLSKSIAIFSILNLIAVALAGFIIFKEEISFVNKIGFILGLISIILIEAF